MLSSMFRRWFNEHIFFPIGRKLSHLNPNHVTAWAYPLALVAAYFISTHSWLLAALFVALSSLVDNLDGAIAKANNKRSKFGILHYTTVH